MKHGNLVAVGVICFAAGLLAGLSIAVLCQDTAPVPTVAAAQPTEATDGIAAERARKLLDGGSPMEAGYAVEPFVPLAASEELVLILLVREHLQKAGQETAGAHANTLVVGASWMKAMSLLQMCFNDPRVFDLLQQPEFERRFRGDNEWYEPQQCFSEIGYEWFFREVETAGLVGLVAEKPKHKPIRTAPNYDYE